MAGACQNRRMTPVVAFINRPHRAVGWLLLPIWAMVVGQFVEAIEQRNWLWIALQGFASVMLPFSMLWSFGVLKDPTTQKQRCS